MTKLLPVFFTRARPFVRQKTILNCQMLYQLSYMGYIFEPKGGLGPPTFRNHGFLMLYQLSYFDIKQEATESEKRRCVYQTNYYKINCCKLSSASISQE